MSRNNPVFSIIMPTHNSEEFVISAVDSVIRQSHTSWELLIVDDASTDETISIIHGFAKDDSRIKVFQRITNGGPAKARNLAISESCGRFIAFLDSDDFWREDKLQRQLEVFQRTQTPLAFSAYEKVDESGERIGRVVAVPEAVSYRELLGATVIATCTAAYDSERVGRLFMPDILKRQDFGLWLKILRSGEKARATNEPLAYLRKRTGSVSSNKLSAAAYVWKVYRTLEGLSLAQSAFYFTKYAYHASVKAKI
jgi:teichuronic acid biosynthesis glycosyltransferase TuaG